jgi:hypothetical protein
MAKTSPQVFSKAYVPTGKSRSPANEGGGARQSEGNGLLNEKSKPRPELKRGGKVKK